MAGVALLIVANLFLANWTWCRCGQFTRQPRLRVKPTVLLAHGTRQASLTQNLVLGVGLVSWVDYMVSVIPNKIEDAFK